MHIEITSLVPGIGPTYWLVAFVAAWLGMMVAGRLRRRRSEMPRPVSVRVLAPAPRGLLPADAGSRVARTPVRADEENLFDTQQTTLMPLRPARRVYTAQGTQIMTTRQERLAYQAQIDACREGRTARSER